MLLRGKLLAGALYAGLLFGQSPDVDEYVWDTTQGMAGQHRQLEQQRQDDEDLMDILTMVGVVLWR